MQHVIECDVKPNKQYIVGIHPHGITCLVQRLVVCRVCVCVPVVWTLCVCVRACSLWRCSPGWMVHGLAASLITLGEWLG